MLCSFSQPIYSHRRLSAFAFFRGFLGDYHFASCFAARSCLPKWFIITQVCFELGKICKMITPTQIAKSASGATIKHRCNTSCKTTNVVYLITCTKCGKKNVGETGEPTDERPPRWFETQAVREVSCRRTFLFTRTWFSQPQHALLLRP